MRFSISEDAGSDQVHRLEVVKSDDGTTLRILADKDGIRPRSDFQDEERPYKEEDYRLLAEITLVGGEPKVVEP